MRIPERYIIAPVDKETAQELVVKHHYLHRRAPCSASFGLYDKLQKDGLFEGRLVGVIMFGYPASRHLQKGICGEDEADNVIELTRLWVEDGTPRNTESYFVMGAIRKVRWEIIVAYSEPQAGHLGLVYQACSFLYTGLSDPHCEWELDGVPLTAHSRHRFDEWGGIEGAKKVLGDRLRKVQRPRKHRYIFFNTRCKRRRKELLSKLRYPILPYPKQQNFQPYLKAGFPASQKSL